MKHITHVKDESGKTHDVSFLVPTMVENVRAGHPITQRTCLGTTADGGYFLWDEEENPPLDKSSVTDFINLVRSRVYGLND